MPGRLLGRAAAVLVMLITLALVVGELTDTGQRRWWAGRPLTTDTAAGLLVLVVTVLVVNQLLAMRQARHQITEPAQSVPYLPGHAALPCAGHPGTNRSRQPAQH